MKWFSLVHQQSEIHPSKGKKIIPAKDFSDILSSIEILEKASEDAEKLLEETQKKCKKLEQKAKEKGFQEGLETFNKHILYFDQQLKTIRHEMQGMVLPLVLKAAKKIVGKELSINPDVIVDIVIQALKPVTQSRQIKIYVNGADKEILDKQKDHIKERLSQVERFTIEKRDDIPPGGCMIETESGIINASLENQWRALESAFEFFMKK